MPAKKDKPPQLTPQQTWPLVLNKTQLVHLRDLLSILLPPDGARTVSQALAAGESRVVAETQLWKDVSVICRKAKVPLNKEAPDFVIMSTGAPSLDVIRIAEDPDAEEEQQAGMDGDPSTLFAAGDEASLKDQLTSKVMEVLTAAAEAGAASEPPAEPKKKPAKRSKVAKGKKK